MTVIQGLCYTSKEYNITGQKSVFIPDMATEDLNKPNIQETLQKNVSRRSFIKGVGVALGLTAVGGTAAAIERLNNSGGNENNSGTAPGAAGTPQASEASIGTPEAKVSASPITAMTSESETPFSTPATGAPIQESTEPPQPAILESTEAPTPENTEVFGTASMIFETDSSMERRKQTPIESISLNTKLFPDGKAEKMLDNAVLDFKARAYATGQLIKDNGDSGDWSGLQNLLIHYTDPAPVDTNAFAQKLQNSPELLIPILANPAGVNRDIQNLKYLHFDAKKQIKVNFIDEPGQIEITKDAYSTNEATGYSLVVNDDKELTIYCYFLDRKFLPFGVNSAQEMADLNYSLSVPRVLESIIMTHGKVGVEDNNGVQQKISWDSEYLAHGYDGRRTLGGGSIFPEIAEAFAGPQDPAEKWRAGPSLLTIQSPAIS